MANLDFLGDIEPVNFKFDVFKTFLNYAPSPKQEQMHRCNARYRIVAAAARFGKTWVAAHEVKARIFYPIKQMIWVVGPTYEIARKVFREVFEFVATHKEILPPITKMLDNDMKIEFANGTCIHGKSTDNPVSLLGEGVDLMVIDEASRIPGIVWTRYLLTRLTTNMGDLLAISTPNGIGTYFHDLWLRGEIGDDPECISFHATVFDNPLIPKKALLELEKLKISDPIAYEQEVLGKFVSLEGDVFPTYDESVQFTKVDYNPALQADACLDVGVRNPTACMFLHVKERQVRVFDEYCKTGRSSLDNALILKPLFKKYNVKRCVVDPREPDAILIYQKIIPNTKFFAPPATAIPLGLDILRDHMRIDEKTLKPMLVFDKTRCKEIRKEFKLIEYPAGEREIPKDKNNHCISALRYYVTHYCNYLGRVDPHAYSIGGNERMIVAFLADKDASVCSDTGFEHDLDLRHWMGDN